MAEEGQEPHHSRAHPLKQISLAEWNNRTGMSITSIASTGSYSHTNHQQLKQSLSSSLDITDVLLMRRLHHSSGAAGQSSMDRIKLSRALGMRRPVINNHCYTALVRSPIERHFLLTLTAILTAAILVLAVTMLRNYQVLYATVDSFQIMEHRNENETYVLDVREFDEWYEGGELQGALHIPATAIHLAFLHSFGTFHFLYQMRKPDENSSTIIITSNARKVNEETAYELSNMGYQKILVHSGMIKDLIKLDKDLEDDEV